MPELHAFAKLTLSLRITGVRADGYHELDAVMVTVSEPHDVVTVRSADRISVEVSGPFADGVPTDESNLAWRAAELCGGGVAIHIVKNIPPGGGLGGGSADAAAVLRARGAPLDEAGAQIGADVPFCIRGGAARVRGIGDVLEGIEIPELRLVIATPRFGCETAAVYRAWDAMGGPHAEPNDLEPAAQQVEPRLIAFKHAIEGATGHVPFLAGSGSSYAIVCDDPEPVAARLRDAVDAQVWVAFGPAFPQR